MGRISPAGDGLGSGPISRNSLMRRIERAERAVTTALFVFIMFRYPPIIGWKTFDLPTILDDLILTDPFTAAHNEAVFRTQVQVRQRLPDSNRDFHPVLPVPSNQGRRHGLRFQPILKASQERPGDVIRLGLGDGKDG